MVTVVLDVLCAMGVVGAALVTGMADVAHEGSWGSPGGARRPDRPGTGRGLPVPGGRGPDPYARQRGRGTGA
ncbi:hypothetical protein [Streptomyces sp. WZ-12]|uniref:hypothetical protein n=1 Tax=Streptomyces sp. WZ-12 TaxID=3030210 RepID=UPI002381327A|nr:hypothetical protein [Streptomyces sp. WZ-12]